MKNHLLLLLSTFLITSITAQEIKEKESKFYFGFKTGYTIPVSKSTVGSPRTEVGNRFFVQSSEGGNYTMSEKNPFGTRGAGFTLAGNFGYMFNDNFGLEMEFSFLRSTKILDASRDETNSFGKNYFAEQHSYTNMFRAAPMLVVQGNPNKKFTPYAKFGILLPLAGKTIVEVNMKDATGQLSNTLLPVLNQELHNELEAFYSNNPALDRIPIATESFIKAKTAGQFSLGFATRIGVNYNINKNWSLFGELEVNMLTIKAKETEFVDFKSTVNPNLINAAEILLGKEKGSIQSVYTMNDLPEILRLTVYQNEITEASNTNYDVARINEASDQLTFRDSYNSFGIMLGFRYNFNKK